MCKDASAPPGGSLAVGSVCTCPPDPLQDASHAVCQPQLPRCCSPQGLCLSLCQAQELPSLKENLFATTSDE